MISKHRKIHGLTLLLTVAVFALSTVFATPSTAADSYPSRPITLVVPFGVGSGTDVLARLIASHLTRAFGPPVVVDNKPGAGGMIGSAAVARAQPNGYTLLMAGNTTHSVVKSLWKSVPYDTVRDFVAVARVAMFVANALAVHPNFPVNTPEEFVAYAKSNPGKIRYGYGNSGGQIGGAMIKHAADIDLTAVAYRSSPQALTDLMSGQIEAIVVDLATALPHIKAGKVRPLAMLVFKRSSLLPDVRTLGETVIAKDVDVSGWSGVMAPAGTPPDILTRLSNELRKFTARGDIKESLLISGIQLDYLGSEEFLAFQKSEEARWTEMAKVAGIKPE